MLSMKTFEVHAAKTKERVIL